MCILSLSGELWKIVLFPACITATAAKGYKLKVTIILLLLMHTMNIEIAQNKYNGISVSLTCLYTYFFEDS